MAITKALTKTTNRAFRAKKWRGTTKKFSVASRWIGAPQFQIRPGATALVSAVLIIIVVGYSNNNNNCLGAEMVPSDWMTSLGLMSRPPNVSPSTQCLLMHHSKLVQILS